MYINAGMYVETVTVCGRTCGHMEAHFALEFEFEFEFELRLCIRTHGSAAIAFEFEDHMEADILHLVPSV